MHAPGGFLAQEGLGRALTASCRRANMTRDARVEHRLTFACFASVPPSSPPLLAHHTSSYV